MAAGRRLPLPVLLLPLACAALAPRTLTGRDPAGGSAGPGSPPLPRWLQPRSLVSPAEKQRSCLLPPDDGPCRAMVPRWYYDRYTQSCKEFNYGGCHGNANNFLTFDDCEKNCWTIKSECGGPAPPSLLSPGGPPDGAVFPGVSLGWQRGWRGLLGAPGRLRSLGDASHLPLLPLLPVATL